METDLFQSCGHCCVFQVCWHIECSTFTASSFRICNSSTGIPSPPLALFVVMLPKAHLPSHCRVSGSRGVAHMSLQIPFFLSFFLFVLWLRHMTRRSLVPRPRITPRPRAVELSSLHWTAGECLFFHSFSWAFLVAQPINNPLEMRETWVRSLGWEGPLEKGKATHSSTLPWRIPWTV